MYVRPRVLKACEFECYKRAHGLCEARLGRCDSRPQSLHCYICRVAQCFPLRNKYNAEHHLAELKRHTTLAAISRLARAEGGPAAKAPPTAAAPLTRIFSWQR